ncbi:hypothetical protein O9G_002260 [Rozella allomycis CSF55]|uniref:Uncharacterized protein n=1 Tax=Rozella allomycis (strain CSF55) TaxID=988480 RepID=A0A075B0V7_ROZAC|nr:hypothetical protein O9G_002260 [Rozella allomycis CSF55]|eukprot:EPZ36194.1 hypothetical protein O9G_002260 [Rozella allomycis CSF55]
MEDELEYLFKRCGVLNSSGCDSKLRSTLLSLANGVGFNKKCLSGEVAATSPYISIHGYIQPHPFIKAFAQSLNDSDGFFNRFVFFFPEPKQTTLKYQMTLNESLSDVSNELGQLFIALYSFLFKTNISPIEEFNEAALNMVLDLDEKLTLAFLDSYYRLADERKCYTDHEKASKVSKSRDFLFAFILVIHLVETFGLCLNCKDCTTTPLTITVRDVAAAKSLLDIVTKSNDFLIDSVRDLPSIPGLPREEQSKMHKVIVAMLNYFLKEYQNENIFISKTAMTRQFRRVGSEDIARIISKLANIGLCSAFKKSGRGRELVVEVNGIIETIGNFSDFVKEFSEYR